MEISGKFAVLSVTYLQFSDEVSETRILLQ